MSAEAVGLNLTGPMSATHQDAFTMSVKVRLSDDSEVDPTEEISWESLTPNATISEGGEVQVLGEGEVSIKATMGELTGEWSLNASCSYPEPTGENFNTALAHNTVVPPLEWSQAFRAKNSSETSLSLRDVYCKASFNWVSTINLLVTAGWCPACPDYLTAVANMNPELKEAGGLLIYVDVQDYDYAPADSEFANEHLSALLGSTEGYFVGDLNSQPVPRFFGQSPAIEAFPDSYVIRRRDMMVLTSQNLNRESGMIPFVDVALDPEQDWSSFEPPPPPPFESICEEGDDEASEPNDTIEMPGLLTEGVSNAGVCNENPDFFRIETEGEWTLTIEFNHNQSDLDLYQVDEANPDEALQASNGTTNTETLSGTGPATLVVVSYTRTSTLYTITLETSEPAMGGAEGGAEGGAMGGAEGGAEGGAMGGAEG